MGPASAQTCSSPWKYSQSKTQPPNWLFTVVKGFREAGDARLQNGPIPTVHCISWFSPFYIIIFMTRGLRGTLCFLLIIFPFLGSFEANDKAQVSTNSSLV